MKLIYIIPGSGGNFYCENCIRDMAIVQALRKDGHQVTIIPMYLPLLDDHRQVENRSPVFYGAVNLYLKQLFPVLKHLPGWIKKLLNSRFSLNLAAKKAGSTRAAGLDGLTLSMLAGADGGQAEELAALIRWIKANEKPDLVHISNALLAGLAPAITKELGVPAVCSLQDEDTWVNAMDRKTAAGVWEVMAAQSRHITRFVAVSAYYAAFMQETLHIPAHKMAVVYNGIEADKYRTASLDFNPPVIGYLSRLSEEMGLEILIDNFIHLKKQPGMEKTRLHITGGYTHDDVRFLRSIKRKLSRAHLEAEVSFMNSFNQEERALFLKQLTVLSVPAPGGAAFGFYQLEALASGVPVVQPGAGAFPELIRATNGGITYDPALPHALSAALHTLLSDPGRTRETGRKGQEAVHRSFSIEETARQMTAVYRQCLQNRLPEFQEEKNAVGT